MTQPVPEEMAPEGLPASPRVPVRLPDGSVGTVPSHQLDAAINQGYAPLSEKEQADERMRPYMDSLQGQIGSAAIGLARSVSLGLSDKLYTEAPGLLGLESSEVREELNRSREMNPGAELFGELAGVVAPNPAGLVGRVASGAAKSAMALRPAAGLAGRVARAGIEAGVQGAAEGALYGGGHQITEDALGDHETTAEKLFAATAKGGLFGGAVGGGLGVAGGLIGEAAGGLAGKIRGRAADEIAASPNALDSTAEDLADFDARLRESTARQPPMPEGMQASRSVADSMAEKLVRAEAEPLRKEAIRQVYEARKALSSADDALDATTRRATKSGDEFLASMQATRKALFGEAAGKKVVSLIQEGEVDAARTLGATFAMRDGLRAELQTLKGRVGKGDGGVLIGRVEDALEQYDKAMIGTARAGAATIDNVRAGMVLMDRVKQAVGKSAGMGRESITPVQAEFREMYDRLRLHLEDESLWGRAGGAWRERNLATTEMLQRGQAARSAFVDATESVGGDVVLRADPARLKGYLGGIDGAENALKKESIERFIAGHEAQLEAATKHWPLDAQEAAAVAQGRDAIARFRAEFSKAEQEAAVAAQAKKMIAEEATRPTNGWLGIASDAAFAPMRTAERLADMQRTMKRIETKITEGVDGFFSGRAGPARAPMPRPDTERIAEETRRLGANTPAMLERVARVFTGINESAPKVATALAGKAVGSLTWLAARAPKSSTPIGTLMPQIHKPSYSDAQLSKFERSYRAFNEPTSVLEDMKNGEITREGVEYLNDNAPKLMAEIRQKMLEKLATATEPMPYEKRIQLSVLFGIDADPTLSQAFIRTMQASASAQSPHAQGTGAGSGSGRKGRPTDHTTQMTESERIANQ